MIAATILGGWGGLVLLPLSAWARTRSWARTLVFAVLVQAAIVWGLKRAFGRVRPWVALGLPPPVGSPTDFSFPSGHAAGSFCVAVFALIALYAHGVVRMRPLAIAGAIAGLFLAASVALSRVYLGAHFPSDVLAGAAIGSAVGAAAGGLYARRLKGAR
jgi:undecaprenyl-diphosphatase